MDDKLISVIMPVYNAEKFLALSIDSVWHQTYADWELFLVDDASTDASPDIMDRYQQREPRIKAIHLARNGGVAAARNMGLSKARGRYVAFLDSDDLWKETKLEEQLSFMKENEVAFSYTNYEVIFEDGRVSNRIIAGPGQLDYQAMLKGNAIGCLTVMIDRQSVGDFMMPERGHEDYLTWLSLLKKGVIAKKLDRNLAYYRLVRGSLSGNKLSSAKKTWLIYNRYEHLGFLKSVYSFLFYVVRGLGKRFRKKKDKS